MSVIHFKTSLFTIDSWLIVHLPKEASSKLPSRGQVMVKGVINSSPLQTALEPDGMGSHWFRVDGSLQRALGVQAGDIVSLSIEATKDWPEPSVPADVRKALDINPEVQALWKRITPLARWEWLRWIGATGRSETRERRIEVAISKLQSGMRRPCCFNRNACCVPAVSKNGVLRVPDGN